MADSQGTQNEGFEDPEGGFNAFLLVEPNRANQCGEPCTLVPVAEGTPARCMRPRGHLAEYHPNQPKAHLLVDDDGDALFFGGPDLANGAAVQILAHHEIGSTIVEAGQLSAADAEAARPASWPHL